MSDLELLADTMQEWSSTSGDHHMQAAAAIRQLIKLQAAQAQASKPCPYIVTGGENTSWCRLAAQPQINQQLLEAGFIIRRLLDEAVDDFYYETDSDGLIEEAKAAIAAAQEQGE
jgi:hypothetical protein